MTDDDVAREARSVSSQAAGRWPSPDVKRLGEVVREFEEKLPGWWWSVGVCSVSADASCGPDVAGPDADLLTRRDFDEGFHCDLPQPAQISDALKEALNEAISARNEARATQDKAD